MSQDASPQRTSRTLFDEEPSYPAGLRDLGQGLSAWMTPNGSWGETNTGLIAGHGASLLVDTLWDLPKTRAMLAAMAAVTDGAPIGHVVNTHSDGDHWWGNELVAGARIIASRETARHMQKDRPEIIRTVAHAGGALRALGRLPLPGRLSRELCFVGDYMRGMLAPFQLQDLRLTPARITFEERMDLDIGGRKVCLVELGPAHTAGDTIVHVPDARAVFTGDLLFVDSTPVLWEGSVDRWVRALERILALEVETVIPGHGPLTDGKGVQALCDYFRFIEAAARKHGLAGRSPFETARRIARSDEFQASPFARWSCPERLVINVAAVFRQRAGRTGSLGVAERFDLVRKMALLAMELPDARPASLHRDLTSRPGG